MKDKTIAYMFVSLIITGAILLTIQFANILYPALNGYNYYTLNFSKKTGKIKKPYSYLYNDCTGEYIVKTDGEFISTQNGVFGEFINISLATSEYAERFKDTITANHITYIYYRTKEIQDSIDDIDVLELMNKYKIEEAERIRNLDSCKDSFKPIIKP